MDDDKYAWHIRDKALELCALMNEAAKTGLHLSISIVPCMHSNVNQSWGNHPSDFRAIVYAHRESHH
jgi:hypothetical protein